VIVFREVQLIYYIYYLIKNQELIYLITTINERQEVLLSMRASIALRLVVERIVEDIFYLSVHLEYKRPG
jgi:hypothetical protein